MDTQTEALFALHRYFISADCMRVHFEGVVRGRKEYREVDARLYMSQWYGNLYVVVEGWQDLGLTDPDIDKLLESSNVDLLRRFRNGVFHFQRDYYDKRFVEFLTDGEDVVGWVRDLNDHLGRFLLHRMREINEG